MTNPALAVELTMREREALMTMDDWSEQVDIVLSQPITERESTPPREDDREPANSVDFGGQFQEERS